MTGILILIPILFKISVINCDVIKSSLTFVIDDTGSMGDDIKQVLESSNTIFDTVMKTGDSQIENFVLVTFNDPDVRVRAITRDRDVFKQALNNIKVNGGGDCPEYSMSGIERALEESLPRSFLYVFTDASPADHAKYEQVRRLAQKKSSQVVFVLTGKCYDDGEKKYYDMADATMGQVFQLGKTDVNVILDFVIESVKGASTVLEKKTLPPGYGHKVNYTVDDHIKDGVLISATGDKPAISDVTGPDGSKPGKEKFIGVGDTTIVKVDADKPGVYTVEVGSKSKTRVLITGKTTIDFQHGFSTFKPTTINDTASRPQRDVKSYLSIKLNIIEGGDVKLTLVKIEDADGKTLLEEPLEVVNDKERFYMTKPIIAPNQMFRITVVGYAVADNSTVTRISPTLLEPQAPELEIKKPRAPKITIQGGPKVVADYNKPVKLSCRINGYPQPDVIWVDESSGSLLPTTVESVEPPYEYISILEIPMVKSNTTYTCKGTNTQGSDAASVAVEIPTYFIVKESPKDAVINYDDPATFVCKIDALPPANITWYKNGNELTDNEEINISDDGSVLTIPKMRLSSQGHYTCNATNGINKEAFNFKVVVTGVEKPKIDKTVNKVHVVNGSDPDVTCKMTEGIPPPKFKWFYRASLKDPYRQLRGFYDNKISFKNVSTHDTGVYICIASNPLGADHHEIELSVEYPPTIKAVSDTINAKAGTEVTLICEVDGIPAPIVRWTKDGVLIENTPSTPIYRDHSLKIKLSVESSGIYRCTASNVLGKVANETKVEVHVPAHIQPPKESPLHLKVGEDINLECDADGFPKPDLTWIIHDKDGRKTVMEHSTRVLSIPRAQLRDAGYYTCKATNIGGSFNITYDVRVEAPPIIENAYKNKVFKPVEGDMALVIKCKATGYPKPVVTWTKDESNIASGTEWYDIDDNGTLYIKNIDKYSDGTYVCRAENTLGQDTEIYSVASTPYPMDESRPATLLIEKGSTVPVPCNIPHDPVDSVRWYKNGHLLLHGELTISNAQFADTGSYACRVSNFVKSQSAFTTISVGVKPKFTSIEDEDIEFAESNFGTLICDTEAYPAAKTTWWHNGVKLNETDSYRVFLMKIPDRGNHTCEASNEFGKVQRTFNIWSKNCMLDVKDDFTGKQPLMFTTPVKTWPSFEVVDGAVIIPKDGYVYLSCPGSSKSPASIMMAFCVHDKTFKINGVPRIYSDIKCDSKVEPTAVATDEECAGEDTRLFKIIYNVTASIIPAYDVCYDINNLIPVYTKHHLDKHLADDEPKDASWWNVGVEPTDMDYIYDCYDQTQEISDFLEKPFHQSDKCCFKKRQLISPRDMVPGVLQSSTYTYVNVAPHWGTCNKNNWDDLEQRIRNLAKSIGYPLTIWTGTSDRLELPSVSSEMIPITIGDMPVPRYLWKVVQDPVTHSSLAIIQVNVPDLESSEVSKYVLCEDVCHEILWLRGGQWRNTSQGYTYCCKLRDFKKAFGFKGVIDRDYNKLLKKVRGETSYLI